MFERQMTVGDVRYAEEDGAAAAEEARKKLSSLGVDLNSDAAKEIMDTVFRTARSASFTKSQLSESEARAAERGWIIGVLALATLVEGAWIYYQKQKINDLHEQVGAVGSISKAISLANSAESNSKRTWTLPSQLQCGSADPGAHTLSVLDGYGTVYSSASAVGFAPDTIHSIAAALDDDKNWPEGVSRPQGLVVKHTCDDEKEMPLYRFVSASEAMKGKTSKK